MVIAHTHIKSTHKGQFSIVNNEQLLVVCPVQDNAICSTVDSLDGITRSLGQIHVGQSFERLAQLLGEVIASREMVRVPENADIVAEFLQRGSRMLPTDMLACLHGPSVPTELTAEFRVRAASTSL